jgi:hypothetical protein
MFDLHYRSNARCFFNVWCFTSLQHVEFNDEERKGVVNICVDMQSRVTAMAKQYFHEMKRNYYVTPTSYLEMLATLTKLLDQKRSDIAHETRRYVFLVHVGVTRRATSRTDNTMNIPGSDHVDC